MTIARRDEARQALCRDKADEIGRNLTTIMEEAGDLDCAEVGRRCGLSNQKVGEVLKGERFVSLLTLYKLSRGLGVSIKRLVPPG